MRIKVLACETLFREIYLAAAKSPHICDIKFLPRDYHDDLEVMRRVLQEEISLTHADRCDDQEPGVRCPVCRKVNYDAVVVAMGLCGYTTIGLRAVDVPLVIPRVHDCFGLLLGGNLRYLSLETRTVFYHQGAVERLGADRVDAVPRRFGLGRTLEEYVRDYGAENGDYIFAMEHSFAKRNERAIFLYHEEFASSAANCRKEVEDYVSQFGWTVEAIPIEMQYFYDMLNARWNREDFIVVDPGKTVDIEVNQEGLILSQKTNQTSSVLR